MGLPFITSTLAERSAAAGEPDYMTTMGSHRRNTVQYMCAVGGYYLYIYELQLIAYYNYMHMHIYDHTVGFLCTCHHTIFIIYIIDILYHCITSKIINVLYSNDVCDVKYLSNTKHNSSYLQEQETVLLFQITRC